jgi:hypothetical protein
MEEAKTISLFWPHHSTRLFSLKLKSVFGLPFRRWVDPAS